MFNLKYRRRTKKYDEHQEREQNEKYACFSSLGECVKNEFGRFIRNFENIYH